MFVTQVFPGALAFWPFALIIIEASGVTFNPSLEWESVIFIFIYLLISAGVGVLIEDIGSLFELRLEKIYFHLQTQPKIARTSDPLVSSHILIAVVKHLTTWAVIFLPPLRNWALGDHIKHRDAARSAKDFDADFYSTWDKYLLLPWKKDFEPVVLRYYRSVLVRFKFELNTSAALMAMLVGHAIYVVYHGGFYTLAVGFGNGPTYLYLFLMFFINSILLMEAFKGIELLDELRRKMTQIPNP